MTSLRSGSASDVGKVRSSNQDVAYESADLFAVADGMGGHVGGEVAARVAVDSLRAAFQRQPSVEGLRRAVAEANRAVWRQSQVESGLRGMGTTLTATALVQEADGRQVVALANVGDSRAYVFSKGQVIQVTADHSLAEEKVRQGQLTQAEAAVHPHRHILTRALGVSSDVDVDLWELHLGDGDRILLCSDGLTNEVGDEQIGEILDSVKEPEEAAKALVQAALDHGGSDNVTCVVIDVAGVVPSAAQVTAGTAGTVGAPGAESVAGGEEANAARSNVVRGGEAALSEPRGPKDVPGALGGPTRTLRVISGGGSSGARIPGRMDTSNGTTTDGTNGANLTDGTNGTTTGGTNGADLAGGTSGISTRSGANLANGASQRPAGGSGGSLSVARLQAAELRRLQPTRHDRRRRRRSAGVPRLITVRVVLFVIVLLGVVAAAYAAMRWYAMDEWYVGVDHSHLAVYQGRPGGFLWFHPQLVDETPVTTNEVLAYEIPHDRSEPSLAVAERYVKALHAEYLAARGTASAGTASAGTASAAGTAPSLAPAATPGTTSTGAGGTTPSTAGAFGSPAAGWQ